jgi:hypothetical protein
MKSKEEKRRVIGVEKGQKLSASTFKDMISSKKMRFEFELEIGRKNKYLGVFFQKQSS